MLDSINLLKQRDIRICGLGLEPLLWKLLPRKADAVRYAEHVANGMDLFRVVCEQDMEGVVAKQASARYTPEATTWVKIKNRQYSQAIGREDFFDRRKAGHWRHTRARSVAVHSREAPQEWHGPVACQSHPNLHSILRFFAFRMESALRP
jgi:hypothetical protein